MVFNEGLEAALEDVRCICVGSPTWLRSPRFPLRFAILTRRTLSLLGPDG
jgi:hypothetical protein